MVPLVCVIVMLLLGQWDSCGKPNVEIVLAEFRTLNLVSMMGDSKPISIDLNGEIGNTRKEKYQNPRRDHEI